MRQALPVRRKPIPFRVQNVLKHHPRLAHAWLTGPRDERKNGIGCLDRSPFSGRIAHGAFELRSAACNATHGLARKGLFFCHFEGREWIADFGKAFALRRMQPAAYRLLMKEVFPAIATNWRPFLFKDLTRYNRSRRH